MYQACIKAVVCGIRTIMRVVIARSTQYNGIERMARAATATEIDPFTLTYPLPRDNIDKEPETYTRVAFCPSPCCGSAKGLAVTTRARRETETKRVNVIPH